MDTLLLTTFDPFSYQIIPDLGLLYLAASLKNSGLTVAVKDLRKDHEDYASLPALVREARPRIVGIKCYSHETGTVRRMAELIRHTHTEAVIVVGGPHPSMDPVSTLAAVPAADYVFIGEAEWSFAEFARWVVEGGTGAPPESVRGIAYRNEGGVERREPVFEEDLGKLPLPAWDLMPPESYPDEAAGMYVPAFPAAPMMLSRGCPFHCAFCGGCFVMGDRIRYRPVKGIMAEIDFLEREHGVKSFTFVDDNFTFSRKRSMALFEALARREPKIAFTFPNGVFAGSLDREMLVLMERAGCYSLSLGIESGSDETLRRMGKKHRIEQVREIVGLIRSTTKIRVTGFFILGYPGETASDVERTIRFARELPIHHPHFCIFSALPGTPVYRELQEQGVISGQGLDPDLFTFDRPSIPLPGFAAGQLVRMHQKAYLMFYLRPWRMFNLLTELRGPAHVWSLLRRAIKLRG